MWWLLSFLYFIVVIEKIFINFIVVVAIFLYLIVVVAKFFIHFIVVVVKFF